MDNDIFKAILTYLGIIILILILFKIIIPVLFSLVVVIINILLKVVMWGAIIYILYLLVKNLYENFTQK